MSVTTSVKAWMTASFLISALTVVASAQQEPIEVIEDNSFLIEEAYNQDPGVVQHIFNFVYSHDPGNRGWAFTFTQEWPLYGLDHQISYTIPSFHVSDEGEHQYGIGDILLNYRYQALEEGPAKPAFAPRFSLIVPTGNRDKGTGNGVVGYQWSLPFSKKVASRLALHANFGLTYLPHVRLPLDDGHLSPKRSLVSYAVGGSAIFAILPRLHAMLEWLGTFEQDINNETGRAERFFKPLISPGFRAAIFNEEELQVVVGVGVPIGLNKQANNIAGFLYFSIEHKLF
ncbi:MAG TPA: transporter [Methylomirabilota bacterium]|nr:transporter [Methylomirabilota bacterium]